MLPLQIGPGLYRWTSAHPEWAPQDDWDEQVGSVFYELPDTVVLFDPLLPRDDREGFLGWLDGRIDGRAVSVLTTIRWHRRDRHVLAERYRANSERAWNALPAGVVPRWLRGAGEVVFWLPDVRSLVVGDRILGAPGGKLRVCPANWLKDERVSRKGLADLLEPLLALPIERVLVSHGEPVLGDGAAALTHAIAEAREGDGGG